MGVVLSPPTKKGLAGCLMWVGRCLMWEGISFPACGKERVVLVQVQTRILQIQILQI
jgi:hypothetical protein